MSEFQRFVSYIHLYEENRKVRNLGFAKIENRGGQCKIEIHMKGTGYTGISCPAYLFVRKAGKMEGIFLGKIPVQNGTGEGRFCMDGNNINESGYKLEQIGGFLIFVNEKIMFASQWDEQEIRREWFMLPEEQPKHQEQPKEGQKRNPDQGGSPAQPGGTKQPVNAAQPAQAGGTKQTVNTAQPAGTKQTVNTAQPANTAKPGSTQQKNRMEPPEETAGAEGPVAAASSEANQPNSSAAQANQRQKSDEQTNPQGITATEAAAARKILPSQPFQQRVFNASMMPGAAPVVSPMKNSPASRMQKAASSAMLVQKAASSAAAQRNIQTVHSHRPSPEGNKQNISSVAAQKGQTSQEEEQPWEQKWKFLLENYPVLTPFEGEEGILCIRMELRDLRVLPKRYWYLGNNSFLLHGFFNYRYLIFGVEETDEAKKWFLGVPGVFQSQEKVMASIFGFPEYKSEKKSGQKTGQFGYWYRYIEL